MADTYAPEQLGEDDPYFETELEEEEKDPLARIEELMARQLRSNSELIERVTGRQQQQQGVPLQQEESYGELEFSLDGLPDPTQDVQAFHREYAKRMAAAAGKTAQGVERRVAEKVTRQSALNAAVARANDLVREANPNLDDETIGAISQVVAARMRASGKDPQAEILRSAESVARDIVDYADDMAGRVRGEARRPTGPGRAQTLGRGRAGNPGRQPTRAEQRREADADPLAMLKDLQAVQQKLRLY